MYYLERVVEEVMSEHSFVVLVLFETDMRAAQMGMGPSKQTSSQNSRVRPLTLRLQRRVGPAAAFAARCAARSSPRESICLTTDKSGPQLRPLPHRSLLEGHHHLSMMVL